MKYCVQVKDRVYVVELREEGECLKVYWEGKPVDVDCRLHQTNSFTSMIIDGCPYDVSWKKDDDNFSVNLHQSVYDVRVSRGLMRGEKETFLKQGSQEELIVAPMPGMVVAVKVNLDQDVKIGEPLLILEAMKMENELRSPVNGRIKQIHVDAGKKVEKGENLLILQK